MSEEIEFGPNTFNALLSHENTLFLHIKALACHCECLAMNAENCHAMCIGKVTPYNDDSYLATMRKWELIDENGNPTI